MTSSLQKVLIVFLTLSLTFIIFRQIIVPLISKTPENLGIKDGRLAPCKKTPNCVSTQADPLDKQHFIPPIRYETTKTEARQKIIKALQNIGGKTKIITQKPDYIHAENRSPTMGYIDDIEIYFEEHSKKIHIRSASRLGYSDFGMNRKRIQQIQSHFQNY
jgi:uncharacterized protein (DUF1499 family)